MINKKFLTALKIISKKLRRKKVKWVLIGSASLALQGIKIKAKDIDILTDKSGAFKINELLKEYEVRPVKIFGTECLGKFKIKGVKVEVMGKLKKRLPSQKIIKIGEMKLPVSSLKEELKAYDSLKRRKDINKIKKIMQVLEDESAIKLC
jgi:predicted nucleotidyltransferase